MQKERNIRGLLKLVSDQALDQHHHISKFGQSTVNTSKYFHTKGFCLQQIHIFISLPCPFLVEIGNFENCNKSNGQCQYQLQLVSILIFLNLDNSPKITIILDQSWSVVSRLQYSNFSRMKTQFEINKTDHRTTIRQPTNIIQRESHEMQ